MDLFGPIAYKSVGGNKYDFVIIDDYPCFTWMFLLRDKREAQEYFKTFAKKESKMSLMLSYRK